LAISQSIERSSLHPFGKLLFYLPRKRKYRFYTPKKSRETNRLGNFRIVKIKTYTLSKLPSRGGLIMAFFEAKNHLADVYQLKYEIKQDRKIIIQT